MARLLDRPDDDELILLRVIAEGYAQSGGWPVWQWVARQVRDRTNAVDPRELLRGLPEWQHNYRLAYAVDSGSLDPAAPQHHIALTIAGMFHAADPTVNELMLSAVTAVAVASDLQADARPPTPAVAVPVRATSTALVDEVVSRLGRSASQDRLLAVLKREPWVWLGLVEESSTNDWYWDLDRAPIHAFHGVTTAESYLRRMDGLIGLPEYPASDMYLPPNALANAFDHLNLAWRLVTGNWLVKIRRLASVATLAEAVSTAKEYQAACVALADTFDSISLDGEGKSLARLSQQLAGLLDDATRAESGVATLRHVNALRNELHGGGDAASRADRARAALGMERFGSDWAAAWNHVRHVTVEALGVIRDELSTLLPS